MQQSKNAVTTPEVDPPQRPSDGWLEAVDTLSIWLQEQQKADDLMESVALDAGIKGFARNRQQALVFGVLRHKIRLENGLKKWVSTQPRPKLWATLLVGAFQIIEADSPEQVAKVVHHAVEQAKIILSKPEVGLINAVLRKVANAHEILKDSTEIPSGTTALARYHSHPKWLVKRWAEHYGAEATEVLLNWNQQPSPSYLYSMAEPTPDLLTGLTPTPWPGYYTINAEGWPAVRKALAEGLAMVQDPFARIPVDQLEVKPGMSVLDLCAAPGGKSRLLASRLSGNSESLLVSMDLPGPRLELLVQGLSRITGIKAHAIGADIRTMTEETLSSRNLPVLFDAVLLDAPCSNSGVIRRRPDVKWRLTPQAISDIAVIQQELLLKAAKFVRVGGKLAYSTCSLEKEENEVVVDTFIKDSEGAFALKATQCSLPGSVGHDGGGVFVLERIR